MAQKQLSSRDVAFLSSWVRPFWICFVEAPWFVVGRLGDGLKRAVTATEATGRGVASTLQGRQKGHYIGYRSTLRSAGTYGVIAAFWGLIEADLTSTMLLSATVIGALIAPGLAPWLRLFPVTGDPRYESWQRVADLTVNMLYHLLATSVFVFAVKVIVAGSVVPVFGSFAAPSFFKGSMGLVIANYLRKYATEYLGINVFLKYHPLCQTLMIELESQRDDSEAHKKLRAWNELRELPGPGLIGVLSRGWGTRPRGYRSIIDESKMIDPALGGLIDHILLTVTKFSSANGTKVIDLLPI